MSHTPGPWTCDNEKDMFDTDERTWNVTGADGTFLAYGIPWEQEANARLIAAAPELLHELQRLLSMWEEAIGWEPDYMDMADSARKVIAKATGSVSPKD